MIDGGLSDEQKIAMRMWLFATTDATVISDPGYSAVCRIVDQECAAMEVEIMRLKAAAMPSNEVRLLNERYARARTMIAILRRRAVAAETSERTLRETLTKLIQKWEADREAYPMEDPRAEVAGVAVGLCEDELRDVLNGKGPW